MIIDPARKRAGMMPTDGPADAPSGTVSVFDSGAHDAIASKSTKKHHAVSIYRV